MLVQLQAIVFIYLFLTIQPEHDEKLVRPLFTVIDSKARAANDASQLFIA
ncbi:hypothetical protein [Pseudomonas syringae]|nr:hypothetical protein [Pseudomonas syringae]